MLSSPLGILTFVMVLVASMGICIFNIQQGNNVPMAFGTSIIIFLILYGIFVWAVVLDAKQNSSHPPLQNKRPKKNPPVI